MESQGTYQAGDTANESATPEKVVPLRQPWAQIQMDILTLGARCFSLGATRCLLYLVRYTIGFHTTTVKLTVDEFCKGKRRKEGGRFDGGTDLSRPSVLTGLHELERAHVIAITNEGHGRGTVATYELFPVECWQVERLSIGKKSLPINDDASIGKESSPIAASNGKDFLPKSRIIGKKSLPHINIDKKDIPEKETQTDANASGHGVDTPASDTPPASSAKKSSKPRKERRPPTPEEEYRAALIADVSETRGYKHTNHGMEWKAAGAFWRYYEGKPVPIADVVEFTRIELERPKWEGAPLTLPVILQQYPVYLRGKVGYVNAIKRARAAVDGEYDAPRTSQNGHKPGNIPNTIAFAGD